MHKKIFTATFADASLDDWKHVASHETGEAEPVTKLKWNLDQRIKFDPIYTKENCGQYCKISRNVSLEPWGWRNIAPIRGERDASANRIALDLLNSGADGIRFDLRGLDVNFPSLLKDINPEHCELSFLVDRPGGLLVQFNEYLKHTSSKPLAPYIFWCTPTRDDLDAFARCDNESLAIGIHSHSEKGPEESLLRSMQLALSAIDLMTTLGISPAAAFGQLKMAVTPGNSMLLEIARFRATRILWANLALAYGLKNVTPADLVLHGWIQHVPMPSLEPGGDMLHGTAGATAALLGGCDTILVETAKDADAQKQRIAKNIALVLQHEAMLSKVEDPTGGSYFIETATDRFIDLVWSEITSGS